MYESHVCNYKLNSLQLDDIIMDSFVSFMYVECMYRHSGIVLTCDV